MAGPRTRQVSRAFVKVEEARNSWRGRSVKVRANKSAIKRWFDSIWVVHITRK